MAEGRKPEESNPGKSSKLTIDEEETSRRSWTNLQIRQRLGLCTCTFYSFVGKSRTCKVCQAKKRYLRFKDKSDDFEERFIQRTGEPMTIRFYLHEELEDFIAVSILDGSTAAQVVRQIRLEQNQTDHCLYSIVECWPDYSSKRTLEDFEDISFLNKEHAEMSSRLYFCIQLDSDKYDYLTCRMMYFANPVDARECKDESPRSKDAPSPPWKKDDKERKKSMSLRRWRKEGKEKELQKKKSLEKEDKPEFLDPTHILVEDEYFLRMLGYEFEYDSPDERTEMSTLPSTSDSWSQLAPLRSDFESGLKPTASGPSEVAGKKTDTDASAESTWMAVPQTSTAPGTASTSRASPKESVAGSSAAIAVSDRGTSVNPTFGSTVYVKVSDHDHTLEEVKKFSDPGKHIKWKLRFLLLRNRQFYFAPNHDTMIDFYYKTDEEFEKDVGRLKQICSVDSIQAYTCSAARRFYKAPTGGCIVLRDLEQRDFDHPIKLAFSVMKGKYPTESDILDEYARTTNLWLTAIRLAKHGVKFKKSYKLFRLDEQKYFHDELLKYSSGQRSDMPHFSSKKRYLEAARALFLSQQSEQEATASYQHPKPMEQTYLIPSLIETGDDKAPMDFTGDGTGRLITDPIELMDLRDKRPEPFPFDQFPTELMQKGRHLTQQYYHGKLSRADAERMLRDARRNGAWLLRDCDQRVGLVISYAHNGDKVRHVCVGASPYEDASSDEIVFVFTIDKRIAFYDVHSMLEYYRINLGEKMSCKLTKYVKNASQPDRSPERFLVARKADPLESSIDLENVPQKGPMEKIKSKKYREMFQSKKSSPPAKKDSPGKTDEA